MTNSAIWSLRQRLLAWLLIPLVLWSLASSTLAYLLALHFTTIAYDRSLRAAIFDIRRQITTQNGEAIISLPEAALQMLEWNDQDRVYYRVASASGRHISGEETLPPPPAATLGTIQYYDAVLGSITVRMAAESLEVPGAAEPVLVQVAESTDARRSIARDILVASLISEAVLVVLAAAGVWYGVGRGLAPLERLRQEVRRRSDQDLSAVEARRAPLEAQPLINAINGLLSRLDSALSAHRRFVANAAHQLRTPLAGLQTQAELALRENDPGAIHRSLEQLHLAAGRAAHLVSQLLMLARLEPRSGRPLQSEPLDLTDVARDVAARWVPQALAQGIDLGFDADSESAQVLGDQLLLQELIGNLIDNAVRYTPSGGTATVRIENAAAGVVLHVEDNGPGIPEQERTQVLERFHRGSTTQQIPGSGLGLSIVREIAVTHGAQLKLDAGPGGRGTSVSVTFPRPGEQPATTTVARAAAEPAANVAESR